jgi:hypothetical protein
VEGRFHLARAKAKPYHSTILEQRSAKKFPFSFEEEIGTAQKNTKKLF